MENWSLPFQIIGVVGYLALLSGMIYGIVWVFRDHTKRQKRQKERIVK